MQSSDAKLSRNSLLLALRCYSSAVLNMEQTVLLPSLLRDVPDEHNEPGSSLDLYQDYLMLKAIRNMVESGMVPYEETQKRSGSEDDLESRFHFHLRGLFNIMAALTKKSQNLTGKYLDIIGISR
ncbi:hypothetical protein DNTS_021966 [Danionella cerebrum]|uniref:Mid1-interacting protein 1 n=1 Tax=Danionella cerebrum TaxID=2873325 RepID=A0A553QMF9_9TELE|nr:hypothetical protein DNTS_021966 [Danionella translucida]